MNVYLSIHMDPINTDSPEITVLKLNNLKTEVASEIGLDNYESVDKGNLSSRQNGSVGGEMVKRMIESYEQGL